jgi:hypothetical protein
MKPDLHDVASLALGALVEHQEGRKRELLAMLRTEAFLYIHFSLRKEIERPPLTSTSTPRRTITADDLDV